MSVKTTSLIALTAIFALSACGNDASETPSETKIPAVTSEDTTELPDSTPDAPEPIPQSASEANTPDYVSIVNSLTRPSADRENDAFRKPAAILEFLGIKRGWTVLELEAGSGYYTELLSMAVGPNGRVYMQNPVEFDAFLGDAIPQRLGGDRLSNVEYLKSDFDDVPLAEGTAMLVTWFLGPHELWFYPEGKPEGFGDPLVTFEKIRGILNVNGRLVVVDHAATPGTPKESGGTTHRIDPAIIIDLAAQAGLVVDQQSDVLRNKDDDYEKSVFDPSVRRKTDRFVISFKKAE